MLLNPLQIKLALVGAALAAVAMLSLTVWALLERSAKLSCRVELVVAKDQVAVLSDKIEVQNKSLQKLEATTAQILKRTGLTLEQLAKQHEGTRKTVADLESKIASATPKNADGSAKGCADYLKEWRAEP
jgi:hypothetical protein